MPTQDNNKENLRKLAKEKTGASDEQLRKGEMVGKVRGREVDSTFHDYKFTDAYTGEPIETVQVVHDVPVGVNEDGTLQTAKATDEYITQEDADEVDQARKADQQKQSQAVKDKEAAQAKDSKDTGKETK